MANERKQSASPAPLGLRLRLRRSLRKLTAQLFPLIAYVSLLLGKRRSLSAEGDEVVEIVQRGSDITVVSFAGMAALHGGMVSYEFSEVLRRLSWEPNVVYVRDPVCANYHLRPDGSPGGLDFFAEKVRDAVASTGARYVVAIGTSVGGMAALHFGARLDFDQVVAYSPTWPPERYLLKPGLRALLGRLKLALTKPAIYVERLLLSQMARAQRARLGRAMGLENLLDLDGQLASAARLPHITVFHGAGCPPDAATARSIEAAAGAEIVSLPTPMHNTSGYLKARGQLVSGLVTRVEEQRRASRLAAAESGFPPSGVQRRSEAPVEVTAS